MARGRTGLKYSGKWMAGLATAALLALAPHAASAGKFKVLHSFCGPGDGCSPRGGLTGNGPGNLFGTTAEGGPSNAGVPFELRQKPDTNKLKYSAISFCKHNQCSGVDRPYGNLISDTQGNLYGIDSSGQGAIFELSPPTGGSTKWTSRHLYFFCSQQNCADGTNPIGDLGYAGKDSGVPYDRTSPLYGTTQDGGAHGAGTVYEATNTGGIWSAAVLYNFCSEGKQQCTDGKQPSGGILLNQTGGMFGVTLLGGANSGGTLFELTNAGGQWNRTTLYDFCSKADCSDGLGPLGNLISDGTNLFGVTSAGGNKCKPDPSGCGVIFNVEPNGIPSQETVLHAFCSKKDCRDGDSPQAGLLLDTAGNLYGTTWFGGGHDIDVNGLGGGVVFELFGSTFRVLHSFCSLADCADGEYPRAPLNMDSSGALFGTTSLGGAFGNSTSGGTAFKVQQ